VKKLIITEKPSVARDIAKVLNIRTRKDGFMESDDYIITWAVGHLVTLYEPRDYDESLKRWSYQSLPIIPETIKVKPYPQTKKQLMIIQKLCHREDVESLICATDSGREGELIFRYIYEYVESTKAFSRLWISSMTDEAIKQGFEHLKDGKEYNRLYLSAKCRSESDWLVGINATRAYTTLNNTLLSIGRVQTPTLALVVNRYNEIQDFKPKDYFEVVADYGEFKGTWFSNQISDTKIDKLEEAEKIVEKVKEQDGKVSDIEKKNNNQKPPFLYDLTELQRDGNRQYGYTATQVLEYAQNLYEKRKLITYPRTDSRFLSDDMKDTVIKTMATVNVLPYSKAIEPLMKDGKLQLKFSKRIINNSKITDHHAIIPTDKNPENISLSPQEKHIYQLIVKRFIAVFYDDYKFKTTKVIIDVLGETFVSKGKIISDLGWKKLYQKMSDQDEETLPNLKKGDLMHVHETEVQSKQTSPPKPYTEATLLSAMENAGRFVEEEELKEQLKEAGFGTPATRAGIIERLISVKYIYRKGKSLYPTEKGIKLIQIIPDELKSPEMTGKWERGLTKISQDKLPVEPFMASINRFVAYLVKSAEKSKHLVTFEEDQKRKSNYKIKGKVYGQCPICGEGQITVNSKAYYCSRFLDGCKFTLWKNALDPYGDLTEEMVERLLKDKQIENFEFIQPQTKEEKLATLELETSGRLQLKNVKLKSTSS
jgi:DNA topoisomerase-3